LPSGIRTRALCHSFLGELAGHHWPRLIRCIGPSGLQEHFELACQSVLPITDPVATPRRIFGIAVRDDADMKWDPLAVARHLFLAPQIALQSTDEQVRAMRKQDWFKYIVNVFWGPKAPKQFVWHPWAEDMLEEACNEKELGLSGCASSGKTDFGAVWALANWYCDPLGTKVLVTSTSLKEARKRIWGSIREYFQQSAIPLPGKLLDSIGQIRTFDGKDVGSDKCGLELVACEESQEKEAVGRFIGVKQKRVIVVADELAELTHGILSAYRGNLIANPYCQLMGMANFKGTQDPFGVLTEPADGWKSVTVESSRWRTKWGGVCLRFDGTKSPNLAFETDKWPIYGRRTYEQHKKLGENSVQFWRMCRSFLVPEGVADVIYSEAELVAGGVTDKPVFSERPRIRVAAIDPAFTSGGDKSPIMFGWLGWTIEGKQVLYRDETVPITEDVTSKDPFDLQAAYQFRDECVKRGVEPEHAAYDATGSGISWGTLLAQNWSNQILGVKFGGAPSDGYSESAGVMKPAKDLYVNRVTELWYQGKDYVRAGQIKGLNRDIMEDLTARHYGVKKDGETKILAEPKKDMKLRINRSPDHGDAFLILLDLCRQRLGFYPDGKKPPEVVESEQDSSASDDVYREECFLEDSYAHTY